MAVAMHLRPYQIVLTEEPDHSGWNVSVPSLPGCFTCGDTRAEAISNADDLIPAWCEVLRERGLRVPPRDPDAGAITVRPAP